MIYKQHYIVAGKYLGSAPRKHDIIHGEHCRPLSNLYFCRQCGDVWAKCPVEDASGKVSQWLSFSTLCPKCAGSELEVPGSLYRAWDMRFCEALPESVLRWEVRQQFEHYERWFENATQND